MLVDMILASAIGLHVCSFDVIRILAETVLSIEEKSTAQVGGAENHKMSPVENMVVSYLRMFDPEKEKNQVGEIVLTSIEVNTVEYHLRYLIASHTTDYQNPMLFFNTVAVIVLVVAKFPHMHKVRIFGINADK
ncbi:uncharacterized protein HKW66_Vig0169570 [Vigna angularis]|uniref:Uncharacterized protein n=1 Tax=Phaseolus angularis TaxID=3914 RepID=A0A8T0JPK1_PHAAN|nr:uncharacterized protein HKW66_Vig0169570 [Vigna angularis]